MSNQTNPENQENFAGTSSPRPSSSRFPFFSPPPFYPSRPVRPFASPVRPRNPNPPFIPNFSASRIRATAQRPPIYPFFRPFARTPTRPPVVDDSDDCVEVLNIRPLSRIDPIPTSKPKSRVKSCISRPRMKNMKEFSAANYNVESQRVSAENSEAEQPIP